MERACALDSPRSANAIESALTSVDYMSDISLHCTGQPGHWVSQRLGALQDLVSVTRFTSGTRIRLLLSCHIHDCERNHKTNNWVFPIFNFKLEPLLLSLVKGFKGRGLNSGWSAPKGGLPLGGSANQVVCLTPPGSDI